MRKKMMFSIQRFFAALVFVIFALAATQKPPTTQAQTSPGYLFIPSLAELGCYTNGRACIFDESLPNQMFVFAVNTSQLWRYPSDGGAAELYDLAPHQNTIGDNYNLDFVAVSDTELVFIASQFSTSGNALTIYNTSTNQVRRLTIDFGNITPSNCDALLGPMPFRNIYKFPNSSRVLTCGGSGGPRKLMIIDIAGNQLEQVIDVPSVMANPALIPWRKILVGLDGNIYIQNPWVKIGQNIFDMFGTVNRPQELENSIDILRFNPRDKTWFLLQFPVAMIAPNTDEKDILSNLISEIAAVDAAGNIYYWDDWNGPDSSRISITVFDKDGQFVGQVSDEALVNAGAEALLHQSFRGEIVFLAGFPNILAWVKVEDYMVIPTPTPTPAN
jgi:hypothetical protein